MMYASPELDPNHTTVRHLRREFAVSPNGVATFTGYVESTFGGPTEFARTLAELERGRRMGTPRLATRP